MLSDIVKLNELYVSCVNYINNLLQGNNYISKKDYQKILDSYQDLFDKIKILPDNDKRKMEMIKLANNIDNYVTIHNYNFINHNILVVI